MMACCVRHNLASFACALPQMMACCVRTTCCLHASCVRGCPATPTCTTALMVLRRNELPFRPHLHAHIPRMTFVSTGIFALASFMLALIGLKKFRSFQKPNRIARTFDAFGGRRDTKQGVSGPAPEWRGVSRSCGSSGTAPEPVWGPRGAFWAYKRTRSG